MKRIVHGRVRINYLPLAHFSDIYTLSETPNTIENILKYTPDVTKNKKAARFLQVCPDRRNPYRFMDARSYKLKLAT